MCDRPIDWRFGLAALILSLLVFWLTSCAHPAPAVVRDSPNTVSLPVIQPCVSGERPAPVQSLKDQIARDVWHALQFQQRVALAAKQGLDRQTYGEQLNAATGACP